MFNIFNVVAGEDSLLGDLRVTYLWYILSYNETGNGKMRVANVRVGILRVEVRAKHAST